MLPREADNSDIQITSLFGYLLHTLSFNINVIHIKYRKGTSTSPRGPVYEWSGFETPWNHFAKPSLEYDPILIPFKLSTQNSINVRDRGAVLIHGNICEKCFNYSQLTNEKIKKSWLVLIQFKTDLFIVVKSCKEKSL